MKQPLYSLPTIAALLDLSPYMFLKMVESGVMPAPLEPTACGTRYKYTEADRLKIAEIAKRRLGEPIKHNSKYKMSQDLGIAISSINWHISRGVIPAPQTKVKGWSHLVWTDEEVATIKAFYESRRLRRAARKSA